MTWLHTVLLLAAAADPCPPHHIAVVGASASAGWGVVIPTPPTDHAIPVHHRHADLADVLPAVLGGDREDVSGHTAIWFFSAPHRIGPAVLQSAQAARPTHIVALDFLFWFAYGSHDGQGVPIGRDDIDARLANLNQGLRLLESIEVPVLVGDIPDVSPAADVWPIALLRMDQVPTPEALAAMNLRIREWVASRDDTTLIPLAATVARMQRGESLHLNEHIWPSDSALIQFDQLHPTTLGLVALAELTAASLPPATKPSLRADPNAVLDRVAETTP